MKYWKTIQERFNETINVLKNNFLNYLLLNLGLLWIWLLIFLVIWWISIILIFSLFWLNYDNLYWNFSSKFLVFMIFFVLFLFLIFRVLKATMFVWNFYLTKNIDKWEEIKLSKLFILSYKKLYDRALVDLWYFIIYLWVFVLMWLFFILTLLFHNNVFLFSLFMILFIVGGIYLFVYVSIKYYFADYYCFDNEDFSFKKFNESTNITQKNMRWVFWNILLVIVITYVISAIFWLILSWFGKYWNVYSLHNSSAILWLIFSFWFIVFVVLKYIFNLLAWLFWFIYMYIYYKFLTLSKSKEEQLNEEIIKNI